MKLQCCDYQITDAAEMKRHATVSEVYLDEDPAIEICVRCPKCGQASYGHFPADKLEPGVE